MKIAVFAVCCGIAICNAQEGQQIQGWNLVSDTTLPTVDRKLAEKGLDSAHFCTYKAEGSPEGASKMVLVIPGSCLAWFGVAGFTKPK